MFTSALPGSSLCLLVCLRALLAGVLLGFSDSGCSSGWVVAVSFPGLLFCQWAERPCACCPGLLAGCSCFLPGGRFPFCWLCLGLRVYSPSFHSPRPRFRSLSLSAFLAPASHPWGLLVGACVCLGYFHGLDCPSPSHGGLPIGIPAFLSGSLPVALSHLPGGVRLFRFAGRPSSPFFWLSGALVALPGSLLFILPGFGSLSSRFPVVGLVLCFLPCGLHPVSLSLWPVGCSPVSSVTVPSCVLSWSLGFSIPWQFPRPGLLFPGSRILQLPPPWYCGGIWILPSAPLGCFILLSRLVSCFCFLRRLFRLFSWFQGFLSYFSDLVFCSSQSCLGLQWFWSSCPFRCWGSRLPLPIALFRISSRGLGSFLFPDFVPGWLVLRLLRWCSAVSSCFPAFSRLADPCSFYSPALSLFALFLEALLFMFSSFSPLVL